MERIKDLLNNIDKKKLVIILTSIILLVVLILLLIYFLSGNKFEVNKTEIILDIKNKRNETIYTTLKSKEINKVIFVSSNENIAAVDKNGKVTAVGIGETTITVRYEEEVKAVKVTVAEKTYTIKEGDTLSSIADKYGVSLEELKELNGIENEGIVGKDIIIPTNKEDFTTNTTPEVTRLSLAQTMIYLQEKKSKTLTLTIYPKTLSNEQITWTSSNKEVAIVNGEGKVTAVKEGTAIITAMASNGKKTSCVVSVLGDGYIETFTASEMDEVKKIVNSSGVPKVQVAIINSGKAAKSYSYNCSENEQFEVAALSKSVLGIVAAKMQQDGIIDLDELINTYWYRINTLDYNTCTSDWQSYIGSETSLRKYTATELVENPATLRNALTHSSTIKQGWMSYMIPNDTSSEYFHGGLSKTYARAAFMLAHTWHQLFYEGGIPGIKTDYNYLDDVLTREHALAGFTMQVAMKQSVNEYLQSEILNPLGIKGPSFRKGNSIYFATSYRTSAIDLAKIIALVANDGKYGGRQILKKQTINEIEKVNSNLENQSIAFTYVNNKFIRYGTFGHFASTGYYDLGDLYNYYSYASYDPKKGNGIVITTYGNVASAKKMVNTIEEYVYSKF